MAQRVGNDRLLSLLVSLRYVVLVVLAQPAIC